MYKYITIIIVTVLVVGCSYNRHYTKYSPSKEIVSNTKRLNHHHAAKIIHKYRQGDRLEYDGYTYYKNTIEKKIIRKQRLHKAWAITYREVPGLFVISRKFKEIKSVVIYYSKSSQTKHKVILFYPYNSRRDHHKIYGDTFMVADKDLDEFLSAILYFGKPTIFVPRKTIRKM